MENRKNKYTKKFIFFCFFCIVNIFNLFAEVFIANDGSYAINLPEGFAIAEQDEESILLVNKILPVDCIIATTKKTEAKNTQKAFSRICDEIDSDYDFSSFSWNNRNCVISPVKFPIPNTGRKAYYQGWGLTIPFENEAGFVTVIAYSETYWTEIYNFFIYSILDSICINDADFNLPGPITSKNYPQITKEEYKVKIENTEIPFFIYTNDTEANDSVIKREFSVLKEYSQAPQKTKTKAFERYYKIIYKDSFLRLQDAAFKIGNYFRFSDGKIQSDETVAKGFLKFLQSFNYKRNIEGTDFLNLPEALATKTGDCDPRSMLMAVLLKHNQIDSILMLSLTLKHAVAGVDVKGNGARFPFKQKKYLVAETTAQVDIGLIDQDFSEITAWTGIDFN